MGSFSLWHWLVVIILILLLFGRGRISDMMGDIGKGLKSFKQGIAEDDTPSTRRDDPRQIPPQPTGQQTPIEVIPEPRPADPTPTSPPPSDDSAR
jgi:sec-independent protein translocase protein TatA